MAVIEDLLKSAKKRPVTTAIKLLPLSGAFYAYKTNPTERYVRILEIFFMFYIADLICICSSCVCSGGHDKKFAEKNFVF